MNSSMASMQRSSNRIQHPPSRECGTYRNKPSVAVAVCARVARVLHTKNFAVRASIISTAQRRPADCSKIMHVSAVAKRGDGVRNVAAGLTAVRVCERPPSSRSLLIRAGSLALAYGHPCAGVSPAYRRRLVLPACQEPCHHPHARFNSRALALRRCAFVHRGRRRPIQFLLALIASEALVRTVALSLFTL